MGTPPKLHRQGRFRIHSQGEGEGREEGSQPRLQSIPENRVCCFKNTNSFQHAVKHFAKGTLNTLQTETRPCCKLGASGLRRELSST